MESLKKDYCFNMGFIPGCKSTWRLQISKMSKKDQRGGGAAPGVRRSQS